MKKNIIIVITAVTLSNIFTAAFFSNYYIQSPIVITTRPMVVPRTIKAIPQAPKTSKIEPTKAPISDKDYILSKKNGALLWKVYGLESTWGKNDGCKSHGEYNGYGYGQNGDVWNCFPSFQIVTDKVDAWYTKNLATLSLSEALCLYNTGNATKTCEYYKKYLSL